MRIFKFQCFLFISISFIISNSVNAQSDKKPNVIFIMCDDLNDYLGSFGGHPQAITPNLDKLAKSSIQFVNAQTNIPVCQPSRNSLFTGVYAHDSKDFGWTPLHNQPVLKNNKTMMQLFQENGYKTLGSGKLTHGKPPEEWDEWGANYKHNYGPVYNDGENNVAHPKVPAPYNSIGSVDGSYGRLSTAGVSTGERGKPGWVNGWDKKPFRYINENDRDLLQDEKHAKWAIEKLEKLEKTNQPFFMGLGFVRPHTPLHAPDKYFDLYPIEELELSPWMQNDIDDLHWLENFNKKNKGPKLYRTLLESYNGDRELALKHFLQAYLACVTFVDEQIGKVINALEQSPLSKNTIVVFTSDHGWQMGEKEYLFKNSPWEESTRIPLLIKRGNSPVIGKVTQPVSLIDIYPTLIELCNLKGSNKKNDLGGELGGYSLKPFLKNTNSKDWKGPNGALTMVGNYGNNKSLNEQNFSYRTADYRYIRYSNGKEELYDHKNDTFEWNNLASDKTYVKIKKRLKREMEYILNFSLD
ncbi:sulfatase [Urechidicola vernalis]|uniref:Sulfatase n=1 Tax=Urechidicola vernalis TaxID=3075600 RepID=A0ABU2Y204_9FLAO|nr:sulfatase [Urechidicola sp. P050]MDT0551831.1 sulfatase [Urechidicola sp. P050]